MKPARTDRSERQPETIPRTKPIRVLLLIKGLGAGGAERLLALSAELRDRDDFQYEVAYLLPWKNALVGALEDLDVPVHCLNGSAEWNLRWTGALRRLLKSRPMDIVHVHSPYVAAFARIVIKTLPQAVRPHVVSTEHLPWSGHLRLTRLANTLTFSLDSAHVAVSSAVRDSIPMTLRHRVEVVVHGIALKRVQDEASNRERARAELGADPGEILVATVANLTAQKGYPILLAAAERIVAKGIPVRFVAIGQGPMEAELRSLHERLGLEASFTFLGFKDNPPSLVAGCDLFVLASFYEGLPVALMEALALGLPVVATDVPGVREALSHGREGLLVPPGRADLLAVAIEALIADPNERARMSKAAKSRAAAFDIRRAVVTIEGIYRTIVNGSGAPNAVGMRASRR